ncbi:PspC domain-containing protein [Corynebacterium halotolerans]|uniref:PspC domain-containing protein n=1 Tax=Corynebacterium halotolerans TaxID=225326 RepID=UPI003CE69A98
MSTNPVPFHKRRLQRSAGDRWVGGVLGGVAETYGWNATLVRLLFIAGILIPGVQLLIPLYLIAWFIMPASR